MKKSSFFFFIFLFTTIIYGIIELRYGLFTRPFRIRNYAAIGFLITASGLIHKKRKGTLSLPQYFSRLILGNSGRPDRIVYMDYLRVLAAVLVVTVHVMEYTGSHLAPHTPAWEIITMGSSLFCACNLLFMMISGALLLGAETESLASFYKKRFLKVLIPCFLYYLFYCFYAYGIHAFLPSGWPKLIREFTANSNGLTPHFWLIHVILMFYLGAPVFSAAMKHMSERMLASLAVLIFILHGLFTYMPYLQIHFLTASFLASWESIFILGYFCTTDTAMKYYRLILAGGWLSVLFILFSVHSIEDFAPLIYNNAPPMLFLACSVFLFFRKHRDILFSRIPPLLAALGNYSFSILLIHWAILYGIVEKRLGINGLSFELLGGIPLSVFLTLFISMAFAIIYDNTVVLCADTLIRFLLKKLDQGILWMKRHVSD
ncbi:acyltransferase [Lachnospiraceae bacterium 62-35]